MQLPIGLGDGVCIERAIFSELFEDSGEQRPNPIAFDRTVDDDMRDVDALRSELSRHALRDHAQARLARAEMGKARHAAKRTRGSREEDRASTEGYETPRRLTAHQKA